MPTSRRRCAGWRTGSPPRSAWRCTPVSRYRTGCRAALPDLPKTMAAADRKASELAKACAGRGVGVRAARPGRGGVRGDRAADRAASGTGRSSFCTNRRSARTADPNGLVEGSVITVRLRSADPATHRFVVEPVWSDRGCRQPRGRGTLLAWETRSARTRPSTTTSDRPGGARGREQGQGPARAVRHCGRGGERAGDHPPAGGTQERRGSGMAGRLIALTIM